MQVAIYARHSSDKQENSTRDQLARCQAFCLARGYEVVATYSDEALSGASMANRPGLRRLVEAALDGEFSRIVTEDLSRISRDQSDPALFYKKLMFLGIDLETIAEGEITELHIGLKGTMNALFLKDLSDKTRRGMLAAVMNGSIMGGKIYGYDVVRQLDERGQLIKGARKINEQEAAIVRRIFQEFAKEQQIAAICHRLNADGIPSPRGGRWEQTTLSARAKVGDGILRRTLYKGTHTFGKTATIRHPDTGAEVKMNRPKSDWIQAPVPELAIVEVALFDQVQLLLEEKSLRGREMNLQAAVMTDDEKAELHRIEMRLWRAAKIKRENVKRKHPVYLTSGKLWCGRHDVAFAPVTSGMSGCPEKVCANRNMEVTYLLPRIVEAMKGFNAHDLVKYWASLNFVRSEKIEAISQATDQLDAERNSLRRLLRKLGRDEAGPETLSLIQENERICARLRLEIKRLKNDLAEIEPKDVAVADRTAFKFQLSRLALENDPKDQIASKLLHPCIDKIVVNPNWDEASSSMQHNVEIFYNYLTIIKAFEPKLRED